MHKLRFFKEYFVYFIYFCMLSTGICVEDKKSALQALPFILCCSFITFFFSKQCRIGYLIIIGLFFTLFNFILLNCYFLFHTSFSYEFAMSLMLSNYEEFIEFAQHIFSWKILLVLIICILPFIMFKYFTYSYYFDFLKYWYVFVPICFIGMYYSGAFFYANYVTCNLWKAVGDLYYHHQILQHYNPQPIDFVTDLNKNVSKKIYIVVLSDSVGRSYLSLYDYKYKTTPLMDNLKNTLYIFDNVSTYYDVTFKVLEKILTFSDNEKDEDNIFLYPNLIDFYKKAGFRVYWLSSHHQYGFHEKSSYLISKADEKSFRPVNYKNYYKSRDEILLPQLNKALADNYDKKIIFLHMLGSHTKYDYRYPKNFGNDSEAVLQLQKIDGVYPLFIDYIKSLIYGDYLLHQVIMTVAQYQDVSSFVLYLSDHAEDVDMYGNATFIHGGSSKKKVYEIPFVLWLSDTYKKHNQKFIVELTNNLHKPYEINLLKHSLLDLSRLKHHLIDTSKSIFNKNYKIRQRKCDTLMQ